MNHPREARPHHRRWSVPIGRVFGIQIRVHVTFVLIVFLFWAASTAPGGSGPGNAMLWLAVIFACITAHELSHSVVARSRGIGVRAIVLLPIGGVSEMESMGESASDELAVSVAGPVTSLALAGGAAALAAATGTRLLPVDLLEGPLLARTAWFNLIIAAFNLLPAFPLDGGRVFRALLERRLSREEATHLAAQTGRRFAVAMMIVGVLFNPWLIAIGFFVWFGATGEEAATAMHARLEGVRVRDVMVAEPIVLDAAEPAGTLEALARRTWQRAFPVLEGGRYLGLVTVDGLDLEAAPGATIGAVADRDVPVVSPADFLEEDVLPLLVGAAYEALPVLEGERVVGLLRVDDVARVVRGTKPVAGRG